MRAAAAALILAAACGGGDDASPPDGPSNTEDWDRDVLDTDLAFDLTSREATARLTIAGSTASAAASFEVGDLEIATVEDADGDALEHRIADGELHVVLPPSSEDATIVVGYRFTYRDGLEGADDSPALTLTWPYHCGNLFPCKARRTPADGTRFTLALSGEPDGLVPVYPAAIPEPAPVYQLAWSLGPYVELALGTTTAGTDVSIWHAPAEAGNAAAGGAHLVAAFDFLEDTYGAYRFGDKVGAVAVTWGQGAFGGMEHHPYWHVSRPALSDEHTQIHEAAHGWYGDGVRIRCWEDFVLSEGTTDYLAARAITAVIGQAAGDETWADYAARLAALGPGTAWPDGCGETDVNDFFSPPYMRGAHFYKAVADRIGVAELDAILADFYAAHDDVPAGMQDMLDAIETASGWDPTACAQKWLRDVEIPVDHACP